MESESSFDLIKRSQAGDQEALDRLFERHGPRLRQWAAGRLPRYARDITDTVDLVQDVLIGAFRNIRNFRPRGEGALQKYLRRAVTNRLRDELRKRASRPPQEALPESAVAPGLSPVEEAMGAETFARYEAALTQLSNLQREGVIAFVELGCTDKEIALLLNRPSVDAARMMVTRALARLAKLMTES